MLAMLTIKCSGCKTKLFKYKKIGSGKVLRCHKSRITKILNCRERQGSLVCTCGRVVGVDQGSYYKMMASTFTYSGTKVSK